MRDGPQSTYYTARFRSIPGEYHIYFCPQSRQVKAVYSNSTKEWIPDTNWKKSMTLCKFKAQEPNRDIVFGDIYISEDFYLVVVPYELTEVVDHWQVRRMKTFNNIQAAIQFALI